MVLSGSLRQHQRTDDEVVVMFPRDVTAVIPHIPVRPHTLVRAVKSVALQTQRVHALAVAVDSDRHGSARTRNRALMSATTTWVAFLDDDDEWYPHHVDTLLLAAESTDADVVYPGCDVENPALGGKIPVREEWGRFGREFSASLLRETSYIPVTSLVRTDLAKKALFGPPLGVDTPYDDWGFYLRLLDLGARFHHVSRITWLWSHHGKNTSGQPDRW